jgi:hypothetical protein
MNSSNKNRPPVSSRRFIISMEKKNVTVLEMKKINERKFIGNKSVNLKNKKVYAMSPNKKIKINNPPP